MSRLHKFVYSIVSSYAVVGSMALGTLVSIPLALRYLDREAFAVWIVVTQIVMFISFVDWGLTPAISRILVDVKDRKEAGQYASAVFTGWLTQVLSVFSVALIAWLVLPLLPRFFRIPAGLRGEFQFLVGCQIALLCLGSITRILGQILTAHQYQYVGHYAQTAFFFSVLAVFCVCLRSGFGLVSVPIANTVGWCVYATVLYLSCRSRGLLPFGWRRVTLSITVFREVFALGRDLFLNALGSEILMASQVLILSRTQGVVVAAAWSIATRLFFFTGQLIWRFFDASLPAMAEMMARGEDALLQNRFRSLVRMTGTAGALAAVLYAVVNKPFVELWTGGQISWLRRYDVWLAAWLVVLSAFHGHGSFIVTTKRLGFFRYVFLLEGVCFVPAGLWAGRRYGIDGMVVCSIVCALLFEANYVHRRIAKYFELPRREVLLTWQKKPALALFVLAIAAVPVILLAAPCRPVAQIALSLAVLGPLGLWLWIKQGLHNEWVLLPEWALRMRGFPRHSLERSS